MSRHPLIITLLRVLPVLWLGIIQASPAAAGTGSLPVSEIRIRISGTALDTGLWESVARNLIPVKRNDLYTLENMETAIQSLTDSRLFEFIRVPDPEVTARGVVLFFDLTPFGRIKDIRIRNAFPLFQREVLNVLNIDTGDAYRKQQVDAQAGRVKNLFQRQGFSRPKVRISAEQDPADGHYTVSIDIDKGAYQKIRQVRFQGNTGISTSRLKLAARTWRATLLFGTARRLVQKDMNDDIKTLTSLYRNRGFADIRVEAEAIPDEATGNVDVNFTIIEGPHYTIAFQGNSALSDRSLKKEVVLLKEGNRNNFALRKSIRNLKKKYTGEGFPDAVIRERITDGKTTGTLSRRVDFIIEEGYQYRVSDLKVTGNRTVPEPAIRENILTPDSKGIFQKSVLDEDAAAVRALYRTKGFSQVKTETRIRKTDSGDGKTRHVEIDLVITEGSRARVETVLFSGLSAVSKETALAALTLQPGSFFNPALVETDTGALHQAVSEAGFPHAKVTAGESFTPDGTGVTIRYIIDQGRPVRVGQIFFAGNLRTRDAILADEMEISTGDPFSLSALVNSRQNILGINALDSARLRTVGLKAEEEEVDLILQVSEKKPYFIEAGTGYDTERHLYLNAGIGDRNFTGRNLDLKA
ncbi:MAG: outer membrane protein assembly factor BamA, partial [Desulfobacterales bacterium]|nr:outer membrane protein assembly factor BamA [Desulfobacterales bacterium]